MERLKASFKSIQGAIMAPMGPICIQEAKTESFRGDYLLCFPPPCEDDDSTSTQLPSSSLSLSSDDRHRRRGDSDELFVHPVTSERFFFTPCTSKSIIVETEHSDELARCERIAVLSEDPYRDFLASMEEVAAAHELREWRGLQELLRCYLRLNERKNHKAIVLAFVDLLMRLVEQDKLRGLLSNWGPRIQQGLPAHVMRKLSTWSMQFNCSTNTARIAGMPAWLQLTLLKFSIQSLIILKLATNWQEEADHAWCMSDVYIHHSYGFTVRLLSHRNPVGVCCVVLPDRTLCDLAFGRLRRPSSEPV